MRRKSINVGFTLDGGSEPTDVGRGAPPGRPEDVPPPPPSQGGDSDETRNARPRRSSVNRVAPRGRRRGSTGPTPAWGDGSSDNVGAAQQAPSHVTRGGVARRQTRFSSGGGAPAAFTLDATPRPDDSLPRRGNTGSGVGGYAGFMLDPRPPAKRPPNEPTAAELLADFVADAESGGGGGARGSSGNVSWSGGTTSVSSVQSPSGFAGGSKTPPGLSNEDRAVSYRVARDVEHIAPEDIFAKRDLTYHPKSVAKTLRTAAWTCVALLVFSFFVVGVALFIVHGVYGLRYSMTTGTLSMEESVVVAADGMVGLHTMQPHAGVEVVNMPDAADAVVRLATTPAAVPVIGTAAQRLEFGTYGDSGSFEATGTWEARQGLPVALNGTAGIAFSAGLNASVVFNPSGGSDTGSVAVGPARNGKLVVDGAVVVVTEAESVSLHTDAVSGELVVSSEVRAPALTVTGNSLLGDAVQDAVVVGGTLNVTGAIDLRQATLLVHNPAVGDEHTINHISVGILNATALNFEQKHLTLLDSIDVGPVRSVGGSIYGTGSNPPQFLKPLGGGTSVSVASVGTISSTTSGSDDALRFVREGDSGSIHVTVPSSASNTTVALPNEDGVFVVAATSPHLSVSTTGVVTFDQAQITGTGVIVSGSLAAGFGAISISSDISTTGELRVPLWQAPQDDR